MQTYKTTLTNKVSFPADVNLLTFTLEPPQTLDFQPGQYVILTVPQEAKEPVKRLYSIASSSRENASFDLLIKHLPGGIGSTYASTLAVGQKVEITGPAGVFTLRETPLDKVFLATGTGLAPVRSFLLSHQPHNQHYFLFWGLPTYGELFLFDELKKLAQNDPLFHLTICLSREQSLDPIPEEDRAYFSLGHIDEAVSRLMSSRPQNSLEHYICCRREIVETTRQYLYNKNIDHNLVFFERY